MRIFRFGTCPAVLVLAGLLAGCGAERTNGTSFAAPSPASAEPPPAVRTYDYAHTVIQSANKHTNQHWPVALLRFTDATNIEGTPFGDAEKEAPRDKGDSDVNVEVNIDAADDSDVEDIVNRNRNERQFNKRAREVLKHELVKTEAFTVVERERIEEILREVQFGESEFVDEKTAAGRGKMICVRYILEGSMGLNEDLTLKGELSDDKHAQALIRMSGWQRLTRGKQQERLRQINEIRRQRLQRNVKLAENRYACYISAYDTRTGEVKTSVMGMGENGLEAIRDAVSELVISLTELDDGIRVAAVSGDKIFLDIGENGNVEVGQRFQLVHLGKEVRNRSGVVIGHDETEVGEVEIVEVRNLMSVARSVTSGAEVQRGDLARPAQH